MPPMPSDLTPTPHMIVLPAKVQHLGKYGSFASNTVGKRYSCENFFFLHAIASGRTHGFVEDSMKKEEYGSMGFSSSSSSSSSPWRAARAAASAARSKAISAARMGSLRKDKNSKLVPPRNEFSCQIGASGEKGNSTTTTTTPLLSVFFSQCADGKKRSIFTASFPRQKQPQKPSGSLSLSRSNRNPRKTAAKAGGWGKCLRF